MYSCILVNDIDKAGTLIGNTYTLHIALALSLMVLYYYAFLKYKKGTNILALSILLSAMAFDSAWSMYYSWKFMFTKEVTSAYMMVIPQVVYIIVLVFLLWATLKKPKEIVSESS